MTIKHWLAGTFMVAATFGAATASDLGPDNTQTKHANVTVLAGDPDDGGQIRVLAGGDPPVITHVSHTGLAAVPAQAAPPTVRD